MPLMTVPLNDTLTVTVHDADNPYLCIERKDAGMVRIEPNEVRHLVDVLTLAGGDLAALTRLKEEEG